MSGPVAYDVAMSEIAAHCLDLVAAHLGTRASELRPLDFQIVRLDDGSHAGRVRLASAPMPPEAFEPGVARPSR